MSDLGRPLVTTDSSSDAEMIDRKSASFSGGAGPSLPSAPWHPEQFCAYRALKLSTWSDGTGLSAGSGRPGNSQPARAINNVTMTQRGAFHRALNFVCRVFDPIATIEDLLNAHHAPRAERESFRYGPPQRRPRPQKRTETR